MNSFKFTVSGEPQGKGRPIFGKNKKARTPEKTALYEDLVRIEYRRQCGIHRFPKGVPLKMDVKAYYSIPQSKPKKEQTLMRLLKLLPTKTPDWDNIGKIVSDALNKLAYYDDAQIVDGRVRKYYSDVPRVEVIIEKVIL